MKVPTNAIGMVSILLFSFVLSPETARANQSAYLSSLVTGGSLVIGDKEFGNFSVDHAAGVDLSGILVSTIGGLDGSLGIRFSGSMIASGNATVDLTIRYRVKTTANQLINKLADAFVPVITGNGGWISITETAFKNCWGFGCGELGTLGVGYITAPGDTSEQMSIDPAVNMIYIWKDIYIQGAGDGSSAAIDHIDQLFGQACSGSIGDFVWLDQNGNGLQDAGEPGINGVTVWLLDSLNNLIAVDVTHNQSSGNPNTSKDGYYQFSGLCDAQYKVIVDLNSPPLAGLQPASSPGSSDGNDTVANDSNNPNGTNVTLPVPPGTSDRSNQTIDFGFVTPGTAALGDRVWKDLNGDGIQNCTDTNGNGILGDAGDTGPECNAGIQGVKVQLLGNCDINNPLATDYTDANGFYLFESLIPGNYCVKFDLNTVPPNVCGTVAPQFTLQNQESDDAADSDANPATGVTPAVSLALGQTNRTVDAGIVCKCTLGLQKYCEVPKPTTPYTCTKPINTISMTWDGDCSIAATPPDPSHPAPQVCTPITVPIDIKAWKGLPNTTLLATVSNVTIGQLVTVTGYTGTVNDVVWEILQAGTNVKLGQSTFHLSCSDWDMNSADDCGKLEGDGKLITKSSSLCGGKPCIDDWIFDGMSGGGVTLNCTPTPPPPTNQCQVQNVPVDCTTQGKPTSLTFKYTKGGCFAKSNSQPFGTKFECYDSSFDDTLPIVVGQNDNIGSLKGSQAYTIVNDANGQPVSASNPINPGDSFRISFPGHTFNAESYFTLINQAGGGTEYVDIHTSCSQPLAVEDVFGSMTLVAFNGNEGGNLVTYKYTVANNCTTGVTGIQLIDKVGGVEVLNYGPFSLAAGVTETLPVTPTALITQTTTNIATVSAPLAESASASATVTVAPPVVACATGASTLTLNKKEIDWKLTNGTAQMLQIAKITISWPSANGYLDQVKLDSAKINDGNFNAPTATITTFTGMAADRSIDKNTSKTLKLIFLNNAVKGSYQIKIEFTNGCSVTFP